MDGASVKPCDLRDVDKRNGEGWNYRVMSTAESWERAQAFLATLRARPFEHTSLRPMLDVWRGFEPGVPAPFGFCRHPGAS